MIDAVNQSYVTYTCDYVGQTGTSCGYMNSVPLSELRSGANLLTFPPCKACGTVAILNAAKPEEAGLLNAPHPGFDAVGGLHTPAVRQLIYAQAVKAALAGKEPADVLASYRISD